MENPQLTIADLAALHNVLEFACTRGAFKASEMSQVGQVYDKLTNFLKSIQAQGEAENASTEQASSGETNA